ncbi:MAG: LysM peptidoglycan-binding domain-containing protein [Planctomycetota bacterium]
MRKDLKIGMFIGLFLAIGAIVFLSTRKSLTIPSRAMHDSFEPDSARFEFSLDKVTPGPPPQTTPAQNADITPVHEPPRRDMTQYELPYKVKTSKFHVVRTGETLSKIAKDKYGFSSQWIKIYNANRALLPDGPDKLKVGTKLIIPD